MVDDGKEHLLKVDDLSNLIAVAMWHDSVAHAAAGDQAALVDVYSARYRWPVEPEVAAEGDLPLEFRFGSDYFVPADGPFMAAMYSSQGAAAIDTFKDKSLIASLADRSRTDGKIDSEKVQDLTALLREALIDEQKVRAGGTLQGFHRTFADVARVGLLRNLALIAEIEGNRETSGILRINAMEYSGDEHTACPNAALSLAAWDATNRYPLRPTDTLHNLIRRYPSLETARFSLERLSIRVSRESTGGIAN